MKPLAAALLLMGLGAFMPSDARAHDLQPPYLEVRQLTETRFAVSWSPEGYVQGLDPLAMPSYCIASSTAEGAAIGHRREYACARNPFEKPIRVGLRSGDPSLPTIALYRPLHGDVVQAVLWPANAIWSVETGKGPAQYLMLGMRHILSGYDHLAVVGCLVLLVAGFHRILATVTGFTIGHSISLAWASLHRIEVSTGIVEACIALSVVLLASEVSTPRRSTLTKRWPVAVSSVFGLLHGLGFASFLGEVGLPKGAVFMSLLCFNGGVELGQILVVLLLLGCIRLEGLFCERWTKSSPGKWPPLPRQAFGTAAGIFGAYLLIDMSIG